MRQYFKADKLVRLWYESGGKGSDWYTAARKYVGRVARRYGIPTYRVTAVLAALSPGTSWEADKRDMESVIRALVSGSDPTTVRVTTYRANLLKAIRAYYTDSPEEAARELHGQKIVSFFWNILGDYNKVTVDRWAARAVGHDVDKITARNYRLIEAAYKRAAKKIGTTPAELQAAVWVYIRGKYD